MYQKAPHKCGAFVSSYLALEFLLDNSYADNVIDSVQLIHDSV